MHQKSQAHCSLQPWSGQEQILPFIFCICSGIAVSPWCHIDPPFSHFPLFSEIAWLTGTSLYIFADLWYQWHPPFTECKAEWISSEKKTKLCDDKDHYKELTASLTMCNTRTWGRILNRGIWKFAQTTYISPQRTFAKLYLKRKTKIHIGFLTKQSSSAKWCILAKEKDTPT